MLAAPQTAMTGRPARWRQAPRLPAGWRSLAVLTLGSLALSVWIGGLAAAAPRASAPGRRVQPAADAPPTLLDSARPAVRSFTDQDGLPQNSIRALARDRAGRLWAATQDGAAYFDGVSWTAVALPRELGSNFVTALAVTAEHIWLGTPNGICRYAPAAAQPWQLYALGDGETSPVNCLLTTRDGAKEAVWAGTHDGLFRFQRDRWERPSAVRHLQGQVVNCLTITTSADGATWLWVGTESQGLFRGRLEGGQWERLTTEDGLPSNRITCLAGGLAPDTVWVGTVRGVGQVSGFRPRPLGLLPPGLAAAPINALLESEGPDGAPLLWIGVNQGLYWRRAGRWRRFASPGDLPADIVRCLFVSQPRSGGIWIGQGGGGGVTYLHHGSWWSFSTETGLPSNVAWCAEVWREPDGTETLWAGTLAGLAQWRRGAWTPLGPGSGFQGSNVRSLLTTERSGERILWIGTSANGLWRLKDAVTPRVTPVTTLPTDEHVHCLYAPKADAERLYVGLGSGLMALRTDTLAVESLGLREAVYTLAETAAPNGETRLWAGLDHGIAYRVGSEWKRYELGFGSHPMVNALHATVDNAGAARLWCGLQGGGLVCLEPSDPPRIVERLSSRTAPALPNDVVYHLFEDGRRRLWATTNRGVTCFALDQAERRLMTFTTEDGLPSNECNFGSAGCDFKGRAWVGTVRGLALIDTRHDPPDEAPGRIVIDTLAPEDALAVAKARGAFPHTLRDLSFRYRLLALRHGGEIIYRTQLLPYDREPTAWSARAQRDCSNLAPGDYQLQVWAMDAAGRAVGPATLAFSIRAAPWQQGWAYALYGIALLGFGYAAYDFRVRQLRRNQERRIAALRQLLDSTRVINSTLDVGEVLRKIASESAALVGGAPGGIGLVEDGALALRHIWNGRAWEASEVRFPLGEGIAGSVAATGQPRIVNDARNCPDILYPELLETHGAQGIMDLPIRNRAGVTIGVLDIRRPPERAPFTERDCELVEGLTHQAAVAIENAAINRQLREAVETAERLYRREQEIVTRLQELDVMKNNFLAVTSHEMRTPLTVIRGFIEALSFGMFEPLTERQQAALMTCLKTTDRLARIVEDIFEVLKIQEGYVEINRAPVMLDELIRDILQEVSVFTAKRRQRLSLAVSGETRIEGDAHKLNLSLLNIIQNAIKFTPDEGEIAVTITGGAESVTVEVADTGIGIEPQDLPYIFDRFYTGRDTSRHSSGRFEFNTRGTGLGLTIARSYVAAHEGLIEAASDGPGRGSRFTVTLPRVLAESAKTPITLATAKIRS
ncbi:MAG: hypothetical protein CFK52_12460 [Chloracidobacterium sp. CP2_5A]|nr:MAG: hypothetical protein CFK52_12460 [Chloracidobacterium sp. CP2_5A]